MKVIIHARNIGLTDSMRSYCESHLASHIRRFYDNDAAQLEVHFERAHGIHGGADQEVHLTFHLPNARAIHVEQASDAAFKSLDLARDRLIRRIKEELHRMRNPNAHHAIARPLGRTAAAHERSESE